MVNGRPMLGIHGMGHVQMYVLRDLVVEGEWREADKLPGTTRARAIMHQLRRRGLAYRESGSFAGGDAVFRPMDAADQWFVQYGYLLNRYADTPFVYLNTTTYIP
jgi:hypothetical protein